MSDNLSHSQQSWASPLNAEVPPAGQDEFKALDYGAFKIWPPVVLAPMAGVTNAPFRELCQEHGAGLCTSEMITARPLVEGNRRTEELASFSSSEKVRSLQLYGTDPYYVGEAVKRLVGEGRIDHLDMNFGCPMPKVTRRGGGAALPLKRGLLGNVVRAAVASAEDVPVTIKFRIGIDDHLSTFLDSGRIAADAGCVAVALHARTAAQLYSGTARWQAIAELVDALPGFQVLGNGDIWEAGDALRMMRESGCAGVVIGRGCLGRPWLFRELDQLFSGHDLVAPPTLGGVIEIMIRHARALCAWMGEGPGMLSFRKHATWYIKGFRSAAQLRAQLMGIVRVDDLVEAFSGLDFDQPYPVDALRAVRGKSGGRQRVVLPAGYLDQLDDHTPPTSDGDDGGSGG